MVEVPMATPGPWVEELQLAAARAQARIRKGLRVVTALHTEDPVRSDCPKCPRCQVAGYGLPPIRLTRTSLVTPWACMKLSSSCCSTGSSSRWEASTAMSCKPARSRSWTTSSTRRFTVTPSPEPGVRDGRRGRPGHARHSREVPSATVRDLAGRIRPGTRRDATPFR